ncbi:clathrin-mediated endocytosis regulator UBX3 Ecym_5612 [Eremothecium cymbalariae DBVPG|uniref:UBX domain-containing protein n=1 Tax=Eremothecium cymbalariae (strain CBS 270.75 / DBVPG 7215 / KCTC 17166 / NRRL Y-17582) TaxID=931890 RepID=I6NE56_ERECY|nr:hypothetical protein Ecym_5612 [Eremothecium cymbalariae DBVPG\
MLTEFFQRFLNSQQPTFTPLPGSFPEDEATEPERQRYSVARVQSKLMNILLTPPLMIIYIVFGVMLFIANTLKPVKKLAEYYDNMRIKHSTEHKNQLRTLVETLIQDSARSISPDVVASNSPITHTFSYLYNLQNGIMLPQIVQGGYTDLLRTCTEQGKFALIYLHNPLLFYSLDYVRQVLSNDDVVGMMRRYQVMLWFGDITTPEGLQVANTLKVRQFPFIGFLTIKNDAKFEIICRIEGRLFDFNVASLELKLQQSYSKLIQLRQQRQNRELHRLMVEQDYRFHETLRHDQDRYQVRSGLGENEQQMFDQERIKKEWLLWRKSTLYPEPLQGDICRLNIRTNGGRIVRKFDASLPIEEIYAYVELYMNGMLFSAETYDRPSPPNYNYIYSFKLITPAPRVELDNTKLIRDESAIYPSGTVIVEPPDI